MFASSDSGGDDDEEGDEDDDSEDADGHDTCKFLDLPFKAPSARNLTCIIRPFAFRIRSRAQALRNPVHHRLIITSLYFTSQRL
jgi:hypothetical protein